MQCNNFIWARLSGAKFVCLTETETDAQPTRPTNKNAGKSRDMSSKQHELPMAALSHSLLSFTTMFEIIS